MDMATQAVSEFAEGTSLQRVMMLINSFPSGTAFTLKASAKGISLWLPAMATPAKHKPKKPLSEAKLAWIREKRRRNWERKHPVAGQADQENSAETVQSSPAEKQAASCEKTPSIPTAKALKTPPNTLERRQVFGSESAPPRPVKQWKPMTSPELRRGQTPDDCRQHDETITSHPDISLDEVSVRSSESDSVDPLNTAFSPDFESDDDDDGC